MNKKMKTLVFNATTQELSKEEVDDVSLEYMQAKVGGYIELVSIDDLQNRGIDLFCNEHGKFNDSKPAIYTLYEDKIYDCLMGNLIFCSHDEEGDSIGLTDEQIDYVTNIINNHKLMAGHGFLPYLTQEGVY